MHIGRKLNIKCSLILFLFSCLVRITIKPENAEYPSFAHKDLTTILFCFILLENMANPAISVVVCYKLLEKHGQPCHFSCILFSTIGKHCQPFGKKTWPTLPFQLYFVLIDWKTWPTLPFQV